MMVKHTENFKFLIRGKESIEESVTLRRSTSTEPSIERHPSRKDPDSNRLKISDSEGDPIADRGTHRNEC